MIQFLEDIHSVIYAMLLKYPKLLDYIRDRRYRISDTELTYRQINSLDDARLLFTSRESNKEWRNFSLLDLFYLHVVNKTREFNTNNAQLKPLKALFYDASINYSVIGEVRYSEIALLSLILESIPMGILLYSDGDAILTDNMTLSMTPGALDIRGRTYIFIFLYETFKPYIMKLKEDKQFKSTFDLTEFEDAYQLKPLTKKQRAILKLVDDASYSKITIEKKENGELIIHAEESVGGQAITSEDLLKIFEQKDYANLKAVKRNGKIVAFKFKDTYKL